MGGVPSTTTRDRLPNGDGILVRSWPAAAAPAARILLVHGLAEHSGRYEETGQLLADAGFVVQAFDLPGFGGSGGRRAYVRRWDEYLAVVADRIRWFETESDAPVVLLGHSMGALISLTYVLGAEGVGRPLPNLLVLSAPPIGRPPLPLAIRLAAPVLARVVPTLELSNGLRRDLLSRDPSVGERYAADPFVHPRSTTRLGHELFNAMASAEHTLRRLDTVPVPTLVLQGSDDLIASPSKSDVFRLIDGCDYRLLPGLRHEIFNEPEGPQVVAQVAEWIRSRASGVPSATSPEARAPSTAAAP